MMHRGIPVTTKPPSPLWPRLLAPMLLASLGLHGLLLMMPTGAAGDAPIAPSDSDEDSMALTDVNPSLPQADPSSASPPSSPATTTGESPPTTPTPPAGVGAIVQAQRPANPLIPPGGDAGRSGLGTVSRSTRRIQGQGESSQGSPTNGAGRANGTPTHTATPPPSPPSSSGLSTPGTPAVNPPSRSEPLLPSGRQFSARERQTLREHLQTYADHLNLPQAQVDRLAASIRDRFRYNTEAQSDEVLARQQSQWQVLIRQETGMADLIPEPLATPLAMVYRQRLCLDPAPGMVKVGVLANPDGSHRGDPVVLQSSGYGAVDDQALTLVADQVMPTADLPNAYIFSVEPRVDPVRQPCITPAPGRT